MREQLLDLAVVRIDGDTQPRVAIDQTLVKEYAEAIQAGTELPPVEVVSDGAEHWLVDGFHRYFAHRMLDHKQIRAVVTTGMLSEAQWRSLAANKTHGLRRNNADKAKAVMKALKLRRDLSDAAIAEHTGVSPPTVAKYRQLVPTTPKSLESDRRIGRDGRRIRTRRIGRRSSGNRTKPGIAKNAFTPIRTGTPPPPMTALSMPHNPEMGARTLIEVFDADYLRALVDFLTKHLKGVAV